MRRLLYFRQMDFEFAFWQIVYLITAPKRVYKGFGYRKHTKSQYARDDPAFLVLLSVFLVFSTAGLAFVLGLGLIEYLVLVGYVVLVDVVGAGMVVATSLWFVTNRFMLKPAARAVEDVEWGFCFDVHLNAFFPVLFILHCVELTLIPYWHYYPSPSVLLTVIANLMWLMALVYYVYISFLGYNSLGILQETRLFLLPLVPIFMFIFIAICANWNLCYALMTFYKSRLGHYSL